MIGIVDYGLGNVGAFLKAYDRMDLAVRTVSCPGDLRDTQGLILPGVGAFDWAVNRLNSSGLREALVDYAQSYRRPVLGVCVGMQLLGLCSEEGEQPGLGWINGRVKKLSSRLGSAETIILPHMGWNTCVGDADESLFEGLERARFYFLHSFYFEPADTATIIAKTDYHGAFCCGVRSSNVYGVQFHPEKSHSWGAKLLYNFAKNCCNA